MPVIHARHPINTEFLIIISGDLLIFDAVAAGIINIAIIKKIPTILNEIEIKRAKIIENSNLIFFVFPPLVCKYSSDKHNISNEDQFKYIHKHIINAQPIKYNKSVKLTAKISPNK